MYKGASNVDEMLFEPGFRDERRFCKTFHLDFKNWTNGKSIL